MTTAGRMACSARQLVASSEPGVRQEEEHGREFGGQVRLYRVNREALGVVERRLVRRPAGRGER